MRRYINRLYGQIIELTDDTSGIEHLIPDGVWVHIPCLGIQEFNSNADSNNGLLCFVQSKEEELSVTETPSNGTIFVSFDVHGDDARSVVDSTLQNLQQHLSNGSSTATTYSTAYQCAAGIVEETVTLHNTDKGDMDLIEEVLQRCSLHPEPSLWEELKEIDSCAKMVLANDILRTYSTDPRYCEKAIKLILTGTLEND